MKSIALTQGFSAIVDDEDYDKLMVHRWHAKLGRKRADGSLLMYAARTVHHPDRTNHGEFMHHAVFGSKTKLDHADGDGLNNRKVNLRLVNNHQNSANSQWGYGSSRWKGVSRRTESRSWIAQIRGNGKKIHIGSFREEVDAATAYNFAAYFYQGEFAKFNQPHANAIQPAKEST